MPAAVEAHSSGLVVLQRAATQMTKKSQLTADNVEKLGKMLGPEKTLEEKMRAYQQAGFNIYYMDNSQGERVRRRISGIPSVYSRFAASPAMVPA